MEEDKGTITIKKDTLWKYSTFVLGALLIVMVFLYFNGSKGSTPSGAAVANQQQQAQAVAGPTDLSIFLDNSNLYPTLGPKNAKNTVVEFSDFQCPFCAMAAGASDWSKTLASGQYADLFGVAGMIQDKAAKGDIRFVYVSMSFLGEESVLAAQAGLCANQQNKFWEMHDAIFAAHDGKEGNGKYTKENLKTLAKSVKGLDQTKFADCLDNDKTLKDVQKAGSEASKAASGTPTFYLNGQKVSASNQQFKTALG